MPIKKWLKLYKNLSHSKENWQELARLTLRAPAFLARKSYNFLNNKWAILDLNQRPPACKAGVLNQLN